MMRFTPLTWNLLFIGGLMILMTGCAHRQGLETTTGNPIEFALLGDMPYDARQRGQFLHLVEAVNREPLAFVVHSGDFWFDGLAWKASSTGLPPCGDETFADRLTLANGFRHPFILTPGDNDWTDCHRAKPTPYDPLERLAKLRQTFFPEDRSLGQRTMKLLRQSDDPRFSDYRENAIWTAGNVLFVTLHMVGSNNNLGRTTAMDAEYQARNAANLAWLDRAFELAGNSGNIGVMIIAQANPRFETHWPAKLQRRYLLGGLGITPPKQLSETGFDDFIAALETHTVEFGRPVVYAHGDTHTFRIDKPLVGSFNRRLIENFTRVEGFGFPDTHWLRVTVDPADPDVFTFRPVIVEANRVSD